MSLPIPLNTISRFPRQAYQAIRRWADSHDRGLSFTINAIIAVFFLLIGMSLIFTSVQGGGSTLDAATQENQLQAQTADLAQSDAETGSLKDGMLYWDDSAGNWVNAPGGRDEYTSLPSGHPMRESASILEDQGRQYAIIVEYLTPSGQVEQQSVAFQGTPGTQTVLAEQTVRLSDDDELVGPSSGTTVKDSSNYFAPDAFPESDERYNQLTVKYVVWE